MFNYDKIGVEDFLFNIKSFGNCEHPFEDEKSK